MISKKSIDKRGKNKMGRKFLKKANFILLSLMVSASFTVQSANAGFLDDLVDVASELNEAYEEAKEIQNGQNNNTTKKSAPKPAQNPTPKTIAKQKPKNKEKIIYNPHFNGVDFGDEAPDTTRPRPITPGYNPQKILDDLRTPPKQKTTASSYPESDVSPWKPVELNTNMFEGYRVDGGVMYLTKSGRPNYNRMYLSCPTNDSCIYLYRPLYKTCTGAAYAALVAEAQAELADQKRRQKKEADFEVKLAQERKERELAQKTKQQAKKKQSNAQNQQQNVIDSINSYFGDEEQVIQKPKQSAQIASNIVDDYFENKFGKKGIKTDKNDSYISNNLKDKIMSANPSIQTLGNNPVFIVQSQSGIPIFVPAEKMEVASVLQSEDQAVNVDLLASPLTEIYKDVAKKKTGSSQDSNIPDIPAWYQDQLQNEITPFVVLSDLANTQLINSDIAFEISEEDLYKPGKSAFSIKESNAEQAIKSLMKSSLVQNILADKADEVYPSMIKSKGVLKELKNLKTAVKTADKLAEEGCAGAGVLYMGLKMGERVVGKADFLAADAVSATMKVAAKTLEVGVNKVNAYKTRANDGISVNSHTEPPNRFLNKYGDSKKCQIEVKMSNNRKKTLDVGNWKVAEINGEKYYIPMDDNGNPQSVMLKYNRKPWYQLFSSNEMEVYEANIDMSIDGEDTLTIENIKKLETKEM